MRRHLIKLGVVAAIGTTFILFQNCSKKMEFSTLSSTVTETGGPGATPDPTPTPTPPIYGCTDKFDTIQLPVKLLFVVDLSGSNKDNPHTSVAGDGTDVSKVWRNKVLTQLRNVHNSSFFKYNYVLFRGNISDGTHFTEESSTTRILLGAFTNIVSEIDTAINSFKNTNDVGKTPYRDALTEAKRLIQTDIQNNASDTTTRYSVIFVSDGMPNPNLVTKKYCVDEAGKSRTCRSDFPQDADVPASITEAKNLVTNITSIDNKRVNLNTIFYYRQDYGAEFYAESLMQGMADAGRGKFIKADTQLGNIDLSQQLSILKPGCEE